MSQRFIRRRSGVSVYADAAYPNMRNGFPGGKLLSAWLLPWCVHSLTRTIQPAVCRWIVFFTQELEHLTSYQLPWGFAPNPKVFGTRVMCVEISFVSPVSRVDSKRDTCRQSQDTRRQPQRHLWKFPLQKPPNASI